MARGRHLQFNSIRLSVTEMLGKGSIWFNCESVHDMARCQGKANAVQDDKIYSQREVDELYKQWMRGSVCSGN